MKKIIPIVFALILLTGTSGVSYESVFAQTSDYQKPEIYKPDRLIVKFKPGVSAEKQNSILSTQNSSVVHDLELLKIKIISVPEPALDAVQNALSKNKSVEYAEYVEGAAPTAIPNDPYYEDNDQWYLDKINAEGAWDVTKGGDFPIVILDSGIDVDHPDLASKIIYPYDAENPSNPNINDLPQCGHGTGVAGNAAAVTNNGVGISGLGWDTKIIPVKITRDNCLGYSDSVLLGVQHAVNMGAKVVNLSYGFDGGSGHIQDAADLLRANNGWLVISAGNSGNNPGKTDYPYIIFVGSTTSSDNRSSFSSFGNYLDIAAPGSNILLTTDGGGYQYWSGTSMAAPLVAATLNLLYSIDPTLTSDESFNILKNTAVDLGSSGWDQEFGHGRIDAQAAAQEAANSSPNPPPVTTPENFKVAFIGDQGLGGDSESVLTLINNENVDMVLHQGDFDYADNPNAWDNQINTFLPGIPYFASVGNHDVAQWSSYQQKLQDRLNNIPGAVCTGDLGVKSSCHYQGLFFILSGVGTLGTGHDTYIQNELAADDSVWSICSWHKNQNAMQVGGKTDEVGWGVYEACKDGGAIIVTAHEHSYERTKTLTSTTNQVVDPAWTNPSEVRVAEGSTFAVVSGLGGQSIRDQERCTPTSYPYGCNGEWANIYTSTQGAQSGALFCEFNVNGQEDQATCYFKNISGQTVDTFNITSFMGVEIPQEPPVAYNQSVSTFENIPIDITLLATDANGDPLTYSIISGPSNGSLSGTVPNLTYTPNLDYDGSDSFTFEANDGTDDSNTATVSITVNAIPTSGTLNIRVESSSDDAEQQIASGVMDLTSTDIEIGDDPGHNEDQLGGLRFINVVMPQGATITSAHIEFETDEEDIVSTSVTIRAQDSDDTSTFTTAQNNISNRQITNASVSWNNIPSWDTVSEKHNTPDISTLVQEVANRSGWTPGNSMAFIIDGTGSRTAESWDGESANAALLHIEYDTPVNTPPWAGISSYVTLEDTLLEDSPPGILANATDADGDPITAILDTGVSNGSLSLNADGSFSYTPNENFNGADSFSYHANDGIDDSNIAAVSITVTAVNDVPIANNQTAVTDEDTPLPIILTASDVDGDLLGFSVVSPPSNGGLSGTVPNLTYTPNSGFDGNDSFTFLANDGTDDSNTATVSITVNPINEIHLENITGESNAKKNWKATVTLTVFDSNEIPFSGALVSGTWLGGPSENCTTDSQGQCQVLEISKDASQTFTVDDITGSGINYNSNTNHVGSSITINQDGTIPGNTPPVADNQSVLTIVNTPLGITLSASDTDGDSLTYSVVSSPSNGSISGTEPALTYTPALDFVGSDSFTFRANDGTDDSNLATISINVTPINDPPVANDDIASTDEDSSTIVAVLTNDSDPDGDSFSISTFDGTSAQGASISDNGDGTFTYDPTTSSTLQSLNDGQSQDDTFSYTIEDVYGASDSALVTVTVSGSDDAPSTLSVTSINPNSVTRGSTGLVIQVVGTGFTGSSTVSLENGGGPIPTITNTSFQNSGLIEITIDITSNGPKNTTWDLRVDDGGDSAVLSGALNITR